MNFNNKFIRIYNQKELKIISLILRSFDIYDNRKLDELFDFQYGWDKPRILYFRNQRIDLTVQDYTDVYLISQQLYKLTLEELLEYDSKK